MAKRNSRSEDWGALALVAICFVYGKEMIAVALFVVLVWMGLKYLEKREANRAYRAVNEAAISMDADHQNMLFMQGDPVGTHGNYDAYTLPLTSEWERTLDAHDDGMRGWR